MLQQSQAINSFNNWVRKKYNIYSGIFLNLPFEHIGNIGVMIPVMASYFQAGLDKGLDPQALMDGFWK